MKYRVVEVFNDPKLTDGHGFKIQQKIIFFWVDKKTYSSHLDCNVVMYYAYLNDAKEIVRRLRRSKSRDKKRKRVVY